MTPLNVFLITALFTSLAAMGYFYFEWNETKECLRRAYRENEGLVNAIEASQERLKEMGDLFTQYRKLSKDTEATLKEALQLAKDAVDENTQLRVEVKYFRESLETLKPLFEGGASGAPLSSGPVEPTPDQVNL